MEYDPLENAIKIKDKTLSEIWVILHSHANDWPDLPVGGSSRIHDRTRVDDDDLKLLSTFSECEADIWNSFCSAAGWTVYGAVGLSWCEGAKLEEVWNGWVESDFPLVPLPEFERPARFINPALLPKRVSLKEILAVDNRVLPICASIINAGDDLEFDVERERMEVSTLKVTSFLKSRLEKKADKSAEDENLIEFWADKIKKGEDNGKSST